MMNLKDLPRQTGDVFDLLSKGKFICSNAVDADVKLLYDVVNQNFEGLFDYFLAIGFSLERGDEYFFFARYERTLKADLERKLETAFKWIDWLDLLKTFDPGFGPGYRFSASDLVVREKVDAVLKSKIENLDRQLGGETLLKKMENLVRELDKQGFIELENEISQSWKVLASFRYMEQFVFKIIPPDDLIDEIPE